MKLANAGARVLPVTALLVIEPDEDGELLEADHANKGLLVLAGVGGVVELHRVVSGGRTGSGSGVGATASLRVFRGARVHGLVLRDRERRTPKEEIIVFGGKSVCVVNVTRGDTGEPRLSLSHSVITCSDWVISAVWINAFEALVLNAHNQALRVTLGNVDAGPTAKMICEEKCILYSGQILRNKSSDVSHVAIVGTVFQEVLVWPVRLCAQHEDAPVLHHLKGHEGVIFSVSFNETSRLLCSTSDDRTARIWRVSWDIHAQQDWTKAHVALVHILRESDSRIFRCLSLPNAVVVAKENSNIAVHSIRDRFRRKSLIHSHNGSPVWCLAATRDESLLFSGGGDCAILGVPLLQPSEASITERSGSSSDCPRVVRLINHLLICLFDSGTVSFYRASSRAPIPLLTDDRLAKYGLLEVDEERLVFATLHGEVIVREVVVDEAHHISAKSEIVHKLFPGKIFALHILMDQTYLVCGPQGRMKLMAGGRVTKELSLPKTGEQHWASCAVICNRLQRLFVGDRQGYIHVYALGDKVKEPSFSTTRVHARFGVGDVRLSGDRYLWSIGRDGCLRAFGVTQQDSSLRELNCTRLPFTWLEMFANDEGNLLVLGFRATCFVVYDTSCQQVLLEVPCGGSHRSWAFQVSRHAMTLHFIKDKHLITAHYPAKAFRRLPVKSPVHSRTICALHHFELATRQFITTGGEDTLIKIHEISQTNDSSDVELQSLVSLKSHISSVKSIASVSSSRGTVVMGTCGGRAQIKLWEIANVSDAEVSTSIQVTELSSHLLKGSDKRRRRVWKDADLIHDTEVRYMQVCLERTHSEESVTAYTASSDGVLRKFICSLEGSQDKKHLQLRAESDSIGWCIFSLCALETFLVSGSSDGVIRMWDKKCLQVVRVVGRHTSSVTALHMAGSNVYSGDDSGGIMVSAASDFAATQQHGYRLCHAAQITGMLRLRDWLISSSSDQRLSVWQSMCDGTPFSYETQAITDVSDIQAIAGFPTQTGSMVVIVAGTGMDFFTLAVS